MTVRARIGSVVAGLVAALAGLALLAAPAGAAGRARPGPVPLVVQTVPSLPGVPVTVQGTTRVTGSDGRATFVVASYAGLSGQISVPDATIAPGLKVHFERALGHPSAGQPVQVGLDTYRQVSWTFVNRSGARVAPRSLELMRLRSGAGQQIDLRGKALAAPLWLQASRIVHSVSGLDSKDLYYGVDRVTVDGGDLVFRAQQRFFPTKDQRWTIHLSYFSLQVTSRDWLLGSPTGRKLLVTRPDGRVLTLLLGRKGEVTLPALPRGAYQLSVPDAALKFTHPVALSRDTVVPLRIVTRTDLAILGGLALLAAIAVLLGGSWWRRRAAAKRRSQALPLEPLPSRPVRPGNRSAAHRIVSIRALVLIGAVALGATVAAQPSAHAASSLPEVVAPSPVPAFAYFYIWFDQASWKHAKVDFPSAGKYSSDDVATMTAQVRQAKAAGLSGFLVSWKDKPALDRRLSNLVKVADAEHFRLGLVYEGLDVNRNPLPTDTVAHDLQWFAAHYATEPAFHIYDKPLVIWTGTWRFSTPDIARVTAGVRSKLMVLASARQLTDYQRVAPYVDGNAYYWSSGNPDRSWYAPKLAAMGKLVHSSGGLWIAPAAAGFDARLLGGHMVVTRNNGATLVKEWAAALASSPDAVGVISWNEWSENSYVEPSVRYGTTALQTLAKLTGSHLDVQDNPDSSSTGGAGSSGFSPRIALWVIVGLIAAGIVGLPFIRRRRALDDARVGTP